MSARVAPLAEQKAELTGRLPRDWIRVGARTTTDSGDTGHSHDFVSPARSARSNAHLILAPAESY
jgi:hypothetical protein